MQGGAGRHPDCVGAICGTKATFSHLIQTLERRPVQRPNICNVEKNANSQIFKWLLDSLLLFWPPPAAEIDDAYVQAFLFWYTVHTVMLSYNSRGIKVLQLEWKQVKGQHSETPKCTNLPVMVALELYNFPQQLIFSKEEIPFGAYTQSKKCPRILSAPGLEEPTGPMWT